MRGRPWGGRPCDPERLHAAAPDPKSAGPAGSTRTARGDLTRLRWTDHDRHRDPRPEDEVVRICRDLIRIDTTQLRRRQRARGGARRRPTSWPSCARSVSSRRPSRATRGASASSCGIQGADREPRRAVRPRPPRRRAGQRRRLAGRPVRGGGARRLHLGPRRRRHEGHGRDDPRVRARPRPHRHACRPATSSSSSSPTRRPAARKGSHFLVDQHPEVFEGVTEAISEVGGYSVTAHRPRRRERRAYLLQTAEKGIAWLRLTAHGRAGHGSVPNDENAIVRLAEAIAPDRRAQVAARVHRLGAHAARRPAPSSPATSWSDEDLEELLEHLGGAQGFVRGTLQDTTNVTMLDAGYKHNVIPQHASRQRRLPLPARPRGGAAGDHPRPRRRARRGRGRCTGTSRSRRRSRATSSRRWWPRCAPRTRTPRCCPTACPAAPTTRRCRCSASPATASRRCGCRPTSTSRRCSTASTSGCRVESLRFGARVLGGSSDR